MLSILIIDDSSTALQIDSNFLLADYVKVAITIYDLNKQYVLAIFLILFVLIILELFFRCNLKHDLL